MIECLFIAQIKIKQIDFDKICFILLSFFSFSLLIIL